MTRRSLALAVAGLLLAACGGGGSQQQAVDPTVALRQGAAAMAQLKTVTATLKFTKGAVSFQGFTLASARAAVRLPSDSDATYTVKDQDLSISIEVVIAGGHVFVHVPFSTFQEVTGADAAAIPDLARLFDTTTGLPAVIPAGRNAKYQGHDQAGGVDTYRISATYSAAQVHAMLAQLSSSGDVEAVIWVGTADHLIRKATLDGPFGDGGKESAVEVDISGFNTSVSITSPSP